MKYSIHREIIIDADIKKVFIQIKDFKHWCKWSPWSICEPDHKVRLSGNAGEEGHSMQWNGKIIGSGEINIEKVDAHKIEYDLQFFKPWKSSAKSQLKLEKLTNKTKVTWSMKSSMPFYLFWMIGMMKSWIEMDYDRGLMMLKELSEKGKIKAKTTNEGLSTFGGFSYVGLINESSMADMPKKMGTDFKKILKMLQSNGKTAKHWITIYTNTDMKGKTFKWISACSSEDLQDIDLGADFITGDIKEQKMLKIHHAGSYRFLGNAWAMGMMYLRGKKLKQNAKPFEYYINSPMETGEDDLKTNIYFPVKQ
jgi:effector-binding domain-containing protein